MDRNVFVEVELELVEHHGPERLDVIVGGLTWGDREVGLEKDLLLWNVGDHQAVRMRCRRDVIQLHRPRSVRVHLLLPKAFDLRLLRVLRERVVQERPRRVERRLEELHVVLLRENRRAFSDEHRQPARVIGMRV